MRECKEETLTDGRSLYKYYYLLPFKVGPTGTVPGQVPVLKDLMVKGGAQMAV